VSVRGTARALPALLRIGFAEAVAYRAELLVWVLATTMPLIMLVLWTAVARDAPIGRYGEGQFVAYFLTTFIVRQLTGSWAAWEMNMDVRQGTLAMRLLRPVHPLVTYTVENVAALPMRVVVSVPVAVIALFTLSGDEVTRDPLLWALAALALFGGWLVTVLVNLVIGCLAFYLESSAKVMDVYLAAFFVASGYVVPIEIFPPAVRRVADLLPFRYQIGLPVELVTAAYDGRRAVAWEMVGRQWIFVALFGALTALAWRRGVRRFAAYGG